MNLCFDVKLYGIQQTINIALKGGNPRRGPAILNSGYSTVTVFLDSQAAIRRIRSDYSRAGQSIAKAIIAAIRVSTTIK
jgi:hypothetical protein